ncbi:MAG: hypothetical protein EOR97_30070 [Mesorhizobium sp.]|uniref:hypothetical protein n=1 Tax=Mesorhizobium sp. TaxID=1871066 RepID=UPI000FE56C8B|nr:hypothetical protein [Mesorhizobium sp.]RWN26109.1 MAG: hypothetical protein EOR97_30070 [Mesorhizobium sp.]
MPMLAVGSVKFEELCCDLLRKEFKDAQRSSLKRKRGVAQYGVDVEGFDLDAEPFVVISAKCYADIRGSYLGPWVKEFTDHLGDHWKDKRVKHFVLAVSHECNDDEINDAVLRMTSELKPAGIQFHLWHSHKITELMKDDPVLVGRYFHKHWVEAICGDIVVGHASIEGNVPINSQSWAAVNLPRMVAAELEEMSGKLSKAWSDRLDGAITELRRGNSSDIRKWITDAKADSFLWTNLNANTKAKALRAAGLVTLRDEDIQAASVLLNEADTLAPAPDRTSAAILERSRSGPAAALPLLLEPLVPREREIKAALLIESGDATGAVSLLEPVTGDALTAEAMRLRAIAYFILGEEQKSLNTAVSAVKRRGNTAAPRFTLATLQIAAALAPGVHVQFGGAPDPIAQSLVRSGPDALVLLSEAADSFDRLLEQVDGDFRHETEIWKLAALLLHPKRQAEARRYARSLMSREQLDPSVIAWCLHYGLPMRRGKTKKMLGDRLRRGEGTPGHVVVLALMASRLTDPRPGLAVVRRFGPMFPEASEFFAMWRRQLGEDTGPPEQDYSSAVRWAIVQKDNVPLLAFLATSGASTENILAGAEFLSSRRAYDDVLAVRERLIEIGTVRCLELVARAANRTKQFSLCLQAVEAFQGDALSARLQYARLEAYEGLGQHSRVIADLRGMLKDGDDPHVHDRLLHAYMRIGALKELKAETEKALATRTLDSRQAVQIAFALKTASPETARLALEQIPDKEFPPELSGILLDLAGSLGGLEDLKEQMIRKMVVGEGGFGSVRKFETVEEILAFMQERAEEYRKQFSQWLSGQLPAALAMRFDEKAYGSLFLGSERTRRNNIGDGFPMLLVGQGSRQDPPELPENPELVVDLSGLLLAQRFGIIDDLDKAFQLILPGATPEALLRLREQYSNPNQSVLAALEEIERNASAVRVTERAPQDALLIDRLENVREGNEWIVPAMLEHAFENGHLTRDEVNRVSSRLDFNAQAEPKPLPTTGIRLSAHAVAHLAVLDVLEAVSRSIPTYLEAADLKSLSRDIEILREEESLGLSVENLQQTVADRLASANWRTCADTYREEDEERLATLPAHVRCLMDTLPRDEAKKGSLFWVEDRTLSRQRLRHALYLTDILKVLVGKGILSAPRYSDILREMWVNGYSFIPGHHRDIAAFLEQAPILEGEIVENSPLGDIRRWFALQAENLIHIDPAAHLDADGAVIGETRQLIEMVGILRDLLLIIWQNPNATKEQKLARSAWSATALKLEHAPGALGDASPAGRRRLASMVAAQIISMPLFAELTSDRMSEEDRGLFASWAVNLFDASEHADPELYNDIHDTLAGMAARVLEDPPDIDDDLRLKLQARMGGTIHGFLSLLPADWYDSIAARHGVAEALGRRKVTTLEVDQGLAIRLLDLCEGIEEADGGKRKARLPVHNSKATCRLETDVANDGLPAVFLTVKKRRVNLHPSTVALVHPDPAVRALGVDELKQVADPDRAVSETTIRALLAEPDVERRVALFDEARGGQFRRKVEGLRDRVRNGTALHLENFELPAPSEVFDFLGLPPDFTGGADALVSEASVALSDKVDAEGAIERLSGLPFELPQSLRDDYALRAVEPGAPRHWDSPMWSMTRLLAAGPQPETDSAADNIARLLQASRGIFSGLVRHAARSALRNPTWRELPPDTMLSLVWLFAEHVSRALLPAGFDPSSFNQWLGQREAPTFTDLELQRVLPRWAREFSSKLTSAKVEVAIVARMLRSGLEVPEALKELVGIQREEAWIPTPEASGAAVPGPTSFWIAFDPIPAFVEAGWITAENPFSGRTDTAMARRVLDESRTDSAIIAPAMFMLVDIEQVDRDVLEEISDALARRLADAPLDRTEPAHHALLDVFSRVSAVLGERDLFDRTVVWVAAANARTWPNERIRVNRGDESGRALDALMNAAQLFAVTSGGPLVDQMRMFASIVEDIVQAWPTANAAVVSCLDVVVRKVDAPTAAEALWPSLMRLRARS